MNEKNIKISFSWDDKRKVKATYCVQFFKKKKNFFIKSSPVKFQYFIKLRRNFIKSITKINDTRT